MGFTCSKSHMIPILHSKKFNIKRYVNYEGEPINIDIPRLLEKTGKLSEEKKNDLKLQLPFIPEEHRWFFNMLITM